MNNREMCHFVGRSLLLLLCVAASTAVTICKSADGQTLVSSMLSDWGEPHLAGAAVIGGTFAFPVNEAFVLAVSCPDDVWFACPAPVAVDPDGIYGLVGINDTESCTAYAYPLCWVEVSVTSAVASVRERSVWGAASISTSIPGPTTGVVPDASVSTTARFALTRGASSVVDVAVSGVRVDCYGMAGHECLAQVELTITGHVLAVEIVAGSMAVIPRVGFAADSGDVGYLLNLIAGVTCVDPTLGTFYPAAEPLTLFSVAASRVDPPSGSIAAIRSADGNWSPSCDAPGCTVPVVATLGPFDSLGQREATFGATIEVRNAWDAAFIDYSDASFDASIVVSDTTCVHSAAAWGAIADETPDLMAFLRFPAEVMPGVVTLLSPRHASRLLRSAESSNALDAIRSQAIAAHLTLASGGPQPGPDVLAALQKAADVLLECPAGDSFIWSPIKYGSATCAGLGGFELLKLLATLIRYNSGNMGFPLCPTSQMQ